MLTIGNTRITRIIYQHPETKQWIAVTFPNHIQPPNGTGKAMENVSQFAGWVNGMLKKGGKEIPTNAILRFYSRESIVGETQFIPNGEHRKIITISDKLFTQKDKV